MLIKSLCKFVKWVTLDTPAPELALLAGAIGMSWALFDAYAAQPTETITREKPVEDDSIGSEVVELETEVVKKTAPVDVWDCLGLSDTFSIREAIKTYNSMDSTGRRVFTVSAISMGLFIYYGVASSARLISLANANFELDRRLSLERGWAENVIRTLEDDSKECKRIMDIYEVEFNKGNWRDDNHAIANYRNQIFELNMLNQIIVSYKMIREA